LLLFHILIKVFNANIPTADLNDIYHPEEVSSIDLPRGLTSRTTMPRVNVKSDDMIMLLFMLCMNECMFDTIYDLHTFMFTER
jgi:hypothetical protein